MIRSANFALGTAVNRVAILAECAAAGRSFRIRISNLEERVPHSLDHTIQLCGKLGGAALQGGSLASRRMAVWNFHFSRSASGWASHEVSLCQQVYPGVQSLLFLSKLFQLWQSLSSLGLAPALLGLTGLFLRLSAGRTAIASAPPPQMSTFSRQSPS